MICVPRRRLRTLSQIVGRLGPGRPRIVAHPRHLGLRDVDLGAQEPRTARDWALQDPRRHRGDARRVHESIEPSSYGIQERLRVFSASDVAIEGQVTILFAQKLFRGLRTNVCHVHGCTKCKQCLDDCKSNPRATSLRALQILANNSNLHALQTYCDSYLTPRK